MYLVGGVAFADDSDVIEVQLLGGETKSFETTAPEPESSMFEFLTSEDGTVVADYKVASGKVFFVGHVEYGYLPILGVAEPVEIGGVTYVVTHAVECKIIPVDSEGKQIYGSDPVSFTITSWDDLDISPYIPTIEGMAYDDTHDPEVNFMNADGRTYVEIKVYYTEFNEEGDYTLQMTNDGQPIKYVFTGVTDAEGNPVSNVPDGTYLSAGSSVFTIDGNRAWCVEPEVSTLNGAKYYRNNVPQNIPAAFATLFYSQEPYSDDSLIHAFVSAYIWKHAGYENALDNPRIYNGGSLSELSAEDQQKANEFIAMVEDAADAFENGRTANFVSETEGVTFADGKITVTHNKNESIPTEIVLRAQNPEMLTYYQYGSITYDDGVSGTIEGDKLILTFTEDALKNGAGFTCSMVPADFPTNTYEYYSEYGRQKLMSFGLSDSNRVSITLVENEVEEPETPKDNDNNPKDDPKEESKEEPKTTKLATTSDSLSQFAVAGIAGLIVASGVVAFVLRKRRNA